MKIDSSLYLYIEKNAVDEVGRGYSVGLGRDVVAEFGSSDSEKFELEVEYEVYSGGGISVD